MNPPSLPVPGFRLKYPLARPGGPADGPVSPMAAGRQPEPPARPEPPHRPDEQDGRVRLGHLDMHLHCSIVGTCLTDGELRKVIGRFVDLQRRLWG